MLVWKLQTLNVNMASVRYRCLFPLRHLKGLGHKSCIYSGSEPVELSPETQAIIFVKSFREEDVATCQKAHQLGIPVILDVCDNIFIDDYGAGKKFTPAGNFCKMACQAAAIVTPGEALKEAVQAAIASRYPAANPLVVAIADGSESLSDIQQAFDITQQYRSGPSWFQQKLKTKAIQKAKAFSRRTNSSARRLKHLAVRGKGKMGHLLRKVRVLSPRPTAADSPVAIASPAHPSPSASQASPQQASLQQASPQAADNASASTVPNAEKAPKSEKTSKSEKTATPARQRGFKTQSTPLRPDPWLPAKPGVKTVLWFGNHGAKYGNFGMLNVLEVAPALAAVNQDQPLRLLVVSNSYDKYCQHIKPLPFETAYLRWHPRKIYEYIGASDVVLIPNSRSPFSICKSANRAVLALSQGTPVIASRTPAMEKLGSCIVLDEWEAGLRAYLMPPDASQLDLRRSHLAQAPSVIENHFSGPVIAQQWQHLLNRISQPSLSAMAIAETAPSQPG